MAEITWGRKETIIWPPHKPDLHTGRTVSRANRIWIFRLSPIPGRTVTTRTVLPADLHQDHGHRIGFDPRQVPDAAHDGCETSRLVCARCGRRTRLDTTTGGEADSPSVVRIRAAKRNGFSISERPGSCFWQERSSSICGNRSTTVRRLWACSDFSLFSEESSSFCSSRGRFRRTFDVGKK